MNFSCEEQPRGELDEFSMRNWRRIPADKREACLAVIRAKTPPDMFAKWQEQHQRGMRVGSNYTLFHLEAGMQVRNALRAVLTDADLPEVEYPDGEKHRNWDDFYMGALDDMVAAQ